MSGTPFVPSQALPSERQRALRAIAAAIGAQLVAGILLALLITRVLALEARFGLHATWLLTLGAVLVAWLAAKHWNGASFGAANQVTLARGVLTLLLAALLGVPSGATVATLAVAFALLAAVLDGVDGRLARRRGEASAFGARFDMETDALLILVLAALAWQHGKAGAWILLAGGLRYVFVAASFALPWLARPLPPSKRRQTVCVVQIATLIACLAPFIPPPASAGIALAGLLALGYSFAVDVHWLARRAHG